MDSTNQPVLARVSGSDSGIGRIGTSLRLSDPVIPRPGRALVLLFLHHGYSFLGGSFRTRSLSCFSQLLGKSVRSLVHVLSFLGSLSSFR